MTIVLAMMTSLLLLAGGLQTISLKSSDMRITRNYLNRIRATNLAEANLKLLFAYADLPAIVGTQANCVVSAARDENIITSTATCNGATRTLRGTISAPADIDLPGHCLDNHGQDEVHNKHCLIEGGATVWMQFTL